MNTKRSRAGLSLLESVLMLAVFTSAVLAWRCGFQHRVPAWHEEYAIRLAVQQMNAAVDRPFTAISSHSESHSVVTRTDGSLDATTFNTRVSVTPVDRGMKEVQCEVSWPEAMPGEPSAVRQVRLETRVADNR